MTELEQMRAENLQILQKLVEIDSICECEGMPAQRHCWKMAEIATGRPSPEQTARLAKRMEREIGDYKEALERIAGDRNCECCDNGVEEMPCTCFDFSPRECAENVLTKHALDAEDK